jgi:hypothetical protein
MEELAGRAKAAEAAEAATRGARSMFTEGWVGFDANISQVRVPLLANDRSTSVTGLVWRG